MLTHFNHMITTMCNHIVVTIDYLSTATETFVFPSPANRKGEASETADCIIQGNSMK